MGWGCVWYGGWREGLEMSTIVEWLTCLISFF